jgi:hypothetical protein
MAIAQVQKNAKYLFSAPYTHSGVQELVKWLMDSQGIGQFQLSKRAGLSTAGVYQIVTKSEEEVTRPPRRSTVAALAQSIGAQVRFEEKNNLFELVQDFELPKTESKELSLLLSEIGSVILARRKKLTRDQRKQIVRVVKALL